MTRRRARMVSVAAGACLVLALGFRFAPLRLPSAGTDAPSIASPPGVPESGGESVDPATYQPIVEGNLLSPTRQAPEERAGDAEAPAPPRPPDAAPRYRLAGLIQARDGVMALIDADPDVPGAEIYRLGDRVGPYSFVEATDTSVVLRGPPGTQVLVLDPLPGRSR